MKPFWLSNLNLVLTWTFNKVIGLMCIFMSQASNWIWSFDVHTSGIYTFPLFAYAMVLPLLLFFVLKSRVRIYLILFLIRRPGAHEAFLPCCLSSSKLLNSHYRTSYLWMRVWSEDWWDIVLLHFTDIESKENFRITWQSFMTLHSTKTTNLSMHHMALHHF